MTLQASGAISFNDINIELGKSGTAQCDLGTVVTNMSVLTAGSQVSLTDAYSRNGHFISEIINNTYPTTFYCSGSITTDSSGNYYSMFLGNYTTPYIGKFTSNGTLSWIKSFPALSSVYFANIVYNSADGNLYGCYLGVPSSQQNLYVFSMTTAGVIRWTGAVWLNASSGSGRCYAVFDGAGYVYFTGSMGGSFQISKWTLAGVHQLTRMVGSNGPNTGAYCDGSYLYFGQESGYPKNGPGWTKVDVALTGINSYAYYLPTAASTYNEDAVFDSSGNAYIACTFTGPASTYYVYHTIVKINNTGVKQWDVSINAALLSSDSGIRLAISGSYLYALVGLASVAQLNTSNGSINWIQASTQNNGTGEGYGISSIIADSNKIVTTKHSGKRAILMSSSPKYFTATKSVNTSTYTLGSTSTGVTSNYDPLPASASTWASPSFTDYGTTASSYALSLTDQTANFTVNRASWY